MSHPAGRWITFAVAAVSLLFLAHWALFQPAPSAPGAWHDVPVFSRLLFEMKGQASPAWYVKVTLALLAITGGIACSLAMLILVRTQPSPATLRLAAALALGTWSGIYFFLVLAHPVYRSALGVSVETTWRTALDFAGYAAGYLGPFLLARFFISYPRAATADEWRAHYARKFVEARRATHTGWRLALYPGWARSTEKGESAIRKRVQRELHQDLTGFINYIDSNRLLPVLLALAALSALADRFGASALTWGVALMTMLMLMVAAFEALDFHFRNSIADDRAKIDWIWGTMVVASIIALAIPSGWWGILPFIVDGLEARGFAPPAAVLLVGPMAIGLQVFFLALVIAIALSIFYRGAVDPRLAVRKVSFFGILGLLVAFFFVLVERAVAVKAVAWLGLPPEVGPILAGAIVAATFAPIRTRVERLVNDKAALWLPLESLVAGERKRLAILLIDLSGYTALSAKDEKEALLVAALLQKRARAAADAGSGRLVKSMGDAVMMAFPSARAAATALESIHREFAPAASALGLTALPVHSGAHVGEVTETEDGDVYGQVVNIAARLQGLAETGRCVVSEEFAREAGTPHRALGPQRLKNVPDPVECMEPLATQ